MRNLREAQADTAARLLGDNTLRTDEARVARAYMVLLSREPAKDEITDARAYLTASPDATRWASFLQAIMAGTEYRYVW